MRKYYTLLQIDDRFAPNQPNTSFFNECAIIFTESFSEFCIAFLLQKMWYLSLDILFYRFFLSSRVLFKLTKKSLF